jgi:hypothetical protein
MSFSEVFYYLGAFYLFVTDFTLCSVGFASLFFAAALTILLFAYKHYEKENNKSTIGKKRKKAS